MTKSVIALLKKDLLLEWRERHAISGIILYVVSTVFVCYLSIGIKSSKINPPTWNALLWIILLFASVNAVAKSFLQESKGRHLYIYTLVSPISLIIAKTIYNSLLMIGLTLVALMFYSMVFDFPKEADVLMYLVATIMGSLSFATIFTMVSAIASKAGNGGMLMAILSFPVLLPLLMVSIKLSRHAIDGLAWSVSYKYLVILVMLNFVVIALATLLFSYLWKE